MRHFHYAIEPAAPFWPCSSQSCDTCINSIMNKTYVVLAYGLYFNMTDTLKRLLWLIVEGPVLITTQSSLSHVVDLWPVVQNQDHQWELVQHYSRSGINSVINIHCKIQSSFFFFLTPRQQTDLSDDIGLARQPILASGVTRSVSRCLRSASHSAVCSKSTII